MQKNDQTIFSFHLLSMTKNDRFCPMSHQSKTIHSVQCVSDSKRNKVVWVRRVSVHHIFRFFFNFLKQLCGIKQFFLMQKHKHLTSPLPMRHKDWITFCFLVFNFIQSSCIVKKYIFKGTSKRRTVGMITHIILRGFLSSSLSFSLTDCVCCVCV